jgi:hypothetical protein
MGARVIPGTDLRPKNRAFHEQDNALGAAHAAPTAQPVHRMHGSSGYRRLEGSPVHRTQRGLFDRWRAGVVFSG